MQHSRGLNVLLVGDRTAFTEALALPLQADGHTVDDAADGQLAVAAARAIFPDVVVLDAEIAGVDVAAVTHDISGLSVRRRPFFIGLAGHTIDGRTASGAKNGVDVYLTKPTALTHLRGLLRRFQDVATDFESFDPVI
jgi:DNA-binding response OmpR family regulator